MSLPSVIRSFHHFLGDFEFPQGILFVLCDSMRYVTSFCLAANLLGFLPSEVLDLTRLNLC
jgi:hypothetical protein